MVKYSVFCCPHHASLTGIQRSLIKKASVVEIHASGDRPYKCIPFSHWSCRPNGNPSMGTS